MQFWVIGRGGVVCDCCCGGWGNMLSFCWQLKAHYGDLPLEELIFLEMLKSAQHCRNCYFVVFMFINITVEYDIHNTPEPWESSGGFSHSLVVMLRYNEIPSKAQRYLYCLNSVVKVLRDWLICSMGHQWYIPSMHPALWTPWLHCNSVGNSFC